MSIKKVAFLYSRQLRLLFPVLCALLVIPAEPAAAQWFGYNAREVEAVKIDLDADFNGDGVIDNHDPADNGRVQITPPGLVIPVGGLNEARIRYKIRRPDRRGDTVVNLEIRPVLPRGKHEGQRSLEEEKRMTGRLRVWSDRSKRRLLLDSGDPNKRHVRFVREEGPAPQQLFIEGVAPSAIEGSLQLIASISNRGKVARFAGSKDYILLTVRR